MTPVQFVTTKDNRQPWPSELRVTEAGATSPTFSRHSWGKHLLHTTLGWVRAAWKWMERKRTQQILSRRLHLAETISLGEKRSLSIVQVDGAQFLIGCSTGSVQLLAVLDKKDEEISLLSHTQRAL